MCQPWDVRFYFNRLSLPLGLEEVQLLHDSPLVGVELRNAPLRSELNVIVVGVRGKDAVMLFNPPSEYAPSEGDRENLRQLERMAEGG